MSDDEVLKGWVSSGDDRGTRDILTTCFVTIWLCTWTSLCLNIPEPRSRGVISVFLYKFRWQIFTIFFPEVLAGTAAEQWLSARQSVKAFAELGHPEWTIRHGFFADMGGILVAPLDSRPFPADGQQLAYLVEKGFLPFPDISTAEIKALNKADGVVRFITLLQMTWFCIAFTARLGTGLPFTTLEVTTLAFIVCTLNTFYFWYYKPLDPEIQKTLPMNFYTAELLSDRSGVATPKPKPTPKPTPTSTPASTSPADCDYDFTPLDFIKPPPDPKSLTTPFWIGLFNVLNHNPEPTDKPAQMLPTHRVLPQYGVAISLSAYLLFLQVVYFGFQIGCAWLAEFPSKVEWYLWTVSNAVDFGLLGLYFAAIPLGTYNAPWVSRWLFGVEVSSIPEFVALLPTWARFLIHGPFVGFYIVGRALVLTESIISLRALPKGVYTSPSWTVFLPHF